MAAALAGPACFASCTSRQSGGVSSGESVRNAQTSALRSTMSGPTFHLPQPLTRARTLDSACGRAVLTTMSVETSPSPQQLPIWNASAKIASGLGALALSLALQFAPPLSGPAVASEFDVLRDPPPQSYYYDDANVLNRVTRGQIQNDLAQLERETGYRLNVVTLRKVTSKADAFEFSDELLEKWYPTVEEGTNKGILLLVTTQKEGAVTGGPSFIESVGEDILESVSTLNLPVFAGEEKYNEAITSSVKRLAAVIRKLPDPGAPAVADSKRVSNYKSKGETASKRDQFTTAVGGLLVIAFVVPMIQFYAYVAKK
eukprot:TRINITY_DN359_c0_g1_i1.p1 TRINITY_DN359_c0_g1~~TRINITY_DN359_c0_g1_i1.p1  ORF type:complete len:315 (-),score=53.09 TRINITY_DN359_c0_g1_i1:717-1661(-)